MKNFVEQHLIKAMIQNIEEVIETKRTRNPGLTGIAAFQELVRDYPDIANGIDGQTRAFLLSKLIEFTLKDRMGFSYGEAFAEVQTANPQLTIKYQRDLEKRRRRK